MVEGPIDNLSIRNYSRTKQPRREINIVGENAAIRRIDPKDREDMSRIRKIQKKLGDEFTDTKLSDEELIKEARDNQPGKDRSPDALYTFGVSGSDRVKDNERGELQGWINIYKDEYVDKYLPQLKEEDQKSFLQLPDDSMILNVAFARYPNAKPGQMASGLRQVCATLSRIEALHQKDTSKTAPELIVTAYASNEDSEQALNAAGFENKGPISLIYPETGKAYDYMLYILDWEKLNDIMHQSALQKVLPSREIVRLRDLEG